MLSVQNVAASILFAVVQPLGGLTADVVGLRAAMGLYGAVTLIAGTGVLLLWSRAEASETADFSQVSPPYADDALPDATTPPARETMRV
jgi:hypothetical protein